MHPLFASVCWSVVTRGLVKTVAQPNCPRVQLLLDKLQNYLLLLVLKNTQIQEIQGADTGGTWCFYRRHMVL